MSSSLTYHSGRAIILRGDAQKLPLPDGSVDLIMTSPPFWQLRSYTDGGQHYDGQIGDEPTPREYIDSLIACTREWMRVLKSSGSLFVELGDKYATRYSSRRGGGRAGLNDDDDTRGRGGQNHTGAGEKSLLDLPHRYAIRCMDELGLILRAEIIWEKPNGLPESVTDRVRRAHEVVFHFTVLPRYFAAVDEIREPHEHHRHDSWDRRPDAVNGIRPRGNVDARVGNNPLGKLPGSVWSIPSAPLVVPASLGVDHFAAYPPELCRRIILGWSPSGVCTACGEGRRPVSVQDFALQPDVSVIRNLDHGRLDASNGWGSVPRGSTSRTITGYACACTPYTDHPGTGEPTRRRDYSPGLRDNNAQGTYGRKQAGEYERAGPWREYHLEDWTPPPTRPALVVDPFGGTGTTALVAAAYGRTGVTVDRSADYCRLARWRTRDPGERARALGVPKPPPVPDGQGSLFDDEEAV